MSNSLERLGSVLDDAIVERELFDDHSYVVSIVRAAREGDTVEAYARVRAMLGDLPGHARVSSHLVTNAISEDVYQLRYGTRSGIRHVSELLKGRFRDSRLCGDYDYRARQLLLAAEEIIARLADSEGRD